MSAVRLMLSLLLLGTLVSSISILSWDPMLDENTAEHNTKMYHVTSPMHTNVPSALYGPSVMGRRLVLRRGRSFLVGLQLSRPLVKGDQVVFSLLEVGKKTEAISWQASLYADPNAEIYNPLSFWAQIEPFGAQPDKPEQTPKVLFRLNYPSDGWIGEFELRAVVKNENFDHATAHDEAHMRDARVSEAPYRLFIVLDPENPADQVYSAKEEDRNEYCYNEIGGIWGGSVDAPDPKPWLYAQFSPEAVDVVAHMLRNLTLSSRSDVVSILRWLRMQFHHLSPRQPTHQGLLIGKWEDSFADGTDPDVWTSSRDIFRQFIDNDYTPVKYGQCFIFAATSTSVLRSLGFPARVLTAYGAATIDPPFNAEGSVKNYYRLNATSGSYQLDHQSGFVWNFHAWTDIWMNRTHPETNVSQFGWEAFDATNLLGPAFTSDIRKEDWQGQFDASVFLSMLVAKIENFVDTDPRPNVTNWELKSTNTDNVGCLLVTKARGENVTEEEDITLEYKKREIMSNRLGPQHGGHGAGACVDWRLSLSSTEWSEDGVETSKPPQLGEDVDVIGQFVLTDECIRLLARDPDADVLSFNVTVNLVLTDYSNRYNPSAGHVPASPVLRSEAVANFTDNNFEESSEEQDENNEGEANESDDAREATLLPSPYTATVILTLDNPEAKINFTVEAGSYTPHLRPGLHHVKLDGFVVFYDPRQPEREFSPSGSSPTPLNLISLPSTNNNNNQPNIIPYTKYSSFSLPKLSINVYPSYQLNNNDGATMLTSQDNTPTDQAAPTSIEVSFTNPFASDITDLQLNTEVYYSRAKAAIQNAEKIYGEGITTMNADSIPGKQKVLFRHHKYFNQPGTYYVVSCLKSANMSNVYGYATFAITPEQIKLSSHYYGGLLTVAAVLCLAAVQAYLRMAKPSREEYIPIPDHESS